MKKISYAGYRFPPEIIHQAIWLYLRFTLSLRDVEDLLAERGLAVSYETVRRWVNHFGPMIAAQLRALSHQPFLLLTTWLPVELGFNKFNASARRQQAAREPFLARCDNARPADRSGVAQPTKSRFDFHMLLA